MLWVWAALTLAAPAGTYPNPRLSTSTAISTGIGFVYLIVLIGIGWTAWTIRDTQNVAHSCGEKPELYGINETNIWLCSMFSGNRLAEQCEVNATQFNKSLSECYKFIPPSD